MSEIFSQNLKNLRKKEGITQVELAKELDVSQNTIYQWENGYEPNLNKLEEIANFFNIEISELITTNTLNKNIYKKNNKWLLPYTNQEEILIKYYNKLTEEQKTELKGFLKGMLVANGVNISEIK